VSQITIHFDGGCGPTNPGNKYGSYEVQISGKTGLVAKYKQFGWGTNNEAEFETLIAALERTRTYLIDAELPAAAFEVELFTDSTIVQNRIAGRNRTKKSEPQSRMFELNARCLEILILFKGFKIQWNPRSANVERFGH
jgi:ribonuclease HI